MAARSLGAPQERTPAPLVVRLPTHADETSVRNDPSFLTSDGPPRNPDAPPRPVDEPPPGPNEPGTVEEPPPAIDDPDNIEDPPPGEAPDTIDDPPRRPDRQIDLSSPSTIVETDIPARLDRLPWSNFHRLVIVALGVTWILDGLEVTLAGTLAGALKESPVLRFTNSDVGFVTSAYLLGAVLGAVFFGWLTDRFGRKKLFFITLAVYLTATGATAFSWDVWSFAVFRFLTGAGIGGEYTAINSTIQELIPARVRGWTDLLINGSFWIGAAAGAAGSIIVLDPAVLHPEYGWRLAFLIGAAIGLVIFFMRIWIPESPRWLMTHGHVAEAEAVVAGIERQVYGERIPSRAGLPTVRLRTRSSTPLGEVATTLFRVYRTRSLVGLTLMASQAFFYNAVFFTYALILIDFYGVSAQGVGWYVLPFAAGNFLGPLLLGRLFDTLGRRPMITFTYAISGHSARRRRLSVQAGADFRPDADHGVDADFLFCFGRGKLRLSHRQRDVSARNPRAHHRLVLRDRHRDRRRRRALGVRRVDRHRIARSRVWRLSGRRRADGRGGGSSVAFRDCRGTQAAGNGGASARLRRLADLKRRGVGT